MTGTTPPIAARDRIPFIQKLCFAGGVNMDTAATGLMKMMWMPVFNIGFGISPVVLGVILMIFRGWDAITDPVMGNISDNAHTRWGRRRPFMFVGAILTAAIYPAFWFMPVELSEQAKHIYLTVTGLVYYTAFTCWSMPYYGLQLELTPNYDERSRLTAWMAVSGKLFSLAAGWLMPLVIALGTLALGQGESLEGKGVFFARLLEPLSSLLAHMPGVHAGEKPIVVGMRLACWLIILATLVFGLLPALFVKERYYEGIVVRQPKEPLWASIKDSLVCRPLWILIIGSSSLSFGLHTVSSLGQYLNIYYVNGGDLMIGSVIGGWKSTFSLVIGLSALPFFVKLGERYDKRRVALGVMGLAFFGHGLNLFFLTPEHPYWLIIPGIFESCGISVFWMFLPSMKADVADYDELKTKRRREGSINAFYSWFLKVAGTLSVGVGGWLLQATGFDVAVGAHQPEAVLQRMFWLYVLMPLVVWSVAIAVLWRFPISRAKAAEIRTELEARRGVM
jgi:glycoside/pentoside/hexuronide:cation symporter, GPH family